MLELKACMRCFGDIITDRDIYGGFKQCLQCGFMVDLVPEAKIRGKRITSLRHKDQPDAA